jgi:hypothetical protein
MRLNDQAFPAGEATARSHREGAVPITASTVHQPGPGHPDDGNYRHSPGRSSIPRGIAPVPAQTCRVPLKKGPPRLSHVTGPGRHVIGSVITVLRRHRRSSAGGLGGRRAGGGVASPTSTAGGPGLARGGGMMVSRSSRSNSGTVIGISLASGSEPASCWRDTATATAR